MADKPTTKNGDGPKITGDANVVEFTSRTGNQHPVKPISRNELISIKALTSYVSHNQKVSDEVVRAIVQTQFHVNELTDISRDDYERVIKFLVDLQVDLLMN